jgi:hypothetical protein
MSLDASKIMALVEKELARVSSPEAEALIRGLLVPPHSEDRPWDYAGFGVKYPCWVVLEHPASNTCIAYCEEGFGPNFPWGLLWMSGDYLSMGMDSGWFDSLEEAVRNSFAWTEKKT